MIRYTCGRLRVDFYALGMIFLGVSTTVGAANFIVTFLRTRAPGMSINRVPILTWGTLTASVANVLVVPAVSLALFLLWMDRQIGSHFFDVAEGGPPLLWQHLFWMFGHPWVYAIVLPAMGMVSDGLPVFCRRPLVGYAPVALSTVATMMLGFGVWVHHMFATGLPSLALSFFSGASIIITVPSAVAVFAWTATIWLGRPVITTAFLYFASGGRLDQIYASIVQGRPNGMPSWARKIPDAQIWEIAAFVKSLSGPSATKGPGQTRPTPPPPPQAPPPPPKSAAPSVQAPPP